MMIEFSSAGHGTANVSVSSPDQKAFGIERDEVDIETQIVIIRVILSTIGKKDDVVTANDRIYLDVSPLIFQALPTHVNGIRLLRVQGPAEGRETKVSYLTFTQWSRKGKVVSVDQTAHFLVVTPAVVTKVTKKLEMNGSG